jgi:hypothetical protein
LIEARSWGIGERATMNIYSVLADSRQASPLHRCTAPDVKA